ncbi:OLC1v1011937C1, partial [Oldenlandia corymbosa var. corymbosa]
IYTIDDRASNVTRHFIIISHFENEKLNSYPYESDNTMLFPLLVLCLFTLFIGSIGIPLSQEVGDLDILSKWLTPSINLFPQELNNSMN